jgi:hypothetical protein
MKRGQIKDWTKKGTNRERREIEEIKKSLLRARVRK